MSLRKRKKLDLEQITHLQIEPSSQCNSQCPHCPRFDFYDQGYSDGTLAPGLKLNHLNLVVLKNLELDKLKNLQRVTLEGDRGDPLMHPNFTELCDTFCQAPSKPKVTVITNGSIRNSEWWEKLGSKKYNNLEIIFSIDGLEDTNHLYRVGLNFKKIISNASAFIKAGGTAIWKLLVFEHNKHQIDNIKELAKNLGFARLHIVGADQTRFKNKDKWKVKYGNNIHYIKWVDHMNETIFYKTTKNNSKKNLKLTNNFICPNLNDGGIYISYENFLIPCCMLHGDTQKEYQGKRELEKLTEGFHNLDLVENSITDILDNNFFTENLENSFYENNLHTTCKKSCSVAIKENLIKQKHKETEYRYE